MERRLSKDQELYLDRKSMMIDQESKFVDIVHEVPDLTHIVLIGFEYQARIPLQVAYELRYRADLSMRLDACEVDLSGEVDTFIDEVLVNRSQNSE